MTPRLVPERLAQAVAERVVALVVDALDVNALFGRVDMNALLDQIDMDRLLNRIDVEALLDRIDVDALLARTDLASMVASAATGTADEALEALRERAARADDSVSGWVAGLVGRA